MRYFELQNCESFAVNSHNRENIKQVKTIISWIDRSILALIEFQRILPPKFDLKVSLAFKTSGTSIKSSICVAGYTRTVTTASHN